MHFYAWKRGLKTGMYYLRTRPKADAIQFTVDQTALAKTKKAGAGAAAGEGSPASASASSTTVTSHVHIESTVVRTLDYAAEAACESCSA